MTAPNHLVGGFTFTGIFGSLLGVNILSDHRLLPIIVFASLLPDIDHTRSIIGKAFLPLSRALNRRYGHRTITHSLAALIFLTGSLSVIQNAFFPSIQVYQVFGLAYGSHLLLDMITVQGIPLFYPFKKNPCVLPGRADLRFRSGNVRHEAIGLCMFSVSALFMQPLMADGFWTSYNRLFGTLPHIVSEYHKSSDLLEVSLTVQHGSEVNEEKGYCISVTDKEITILDNENNFRTYPEEGELITDLYPVHTRKAYSFRDGQFYNIGIDSLKRLFSESKYTHFKIQGTRPFVYYENGIEKQQRSIELEFPNALHIKELENKVEVRYVSSPTIDSKQQQILQLQKTELKNQQRYQTELNHYNSIKAATEQATNHIEKELLMLELAKLKLPKMPTDLSAKVASLEADIRALQLDDQNKYATALKAAQVEPLLFSGSYEVLTIKNVSTLTYQNGCSH